MKTILMLASENDALPRAKVGGIGDVLRDMPRALAEIGYHIHVLTPSHGFLHQLPSARRASHFPVDFAGGVRDATLYELPLTATRFTQPPAAGSVRYWVMQHPDMAPGGAGQIYHDDGAERPFASDAGKYALFCAAAAQALLNHSLGQVDIVHLHDWHAGFFNILRHYCGYASALKSLPCVFTIHNLALQGVRPLWGDPSSLAQWFPNVRLDRAQFGDPRNPHCVNPMRAGIRLSERVHAVSPSYALEIQKPSRAEDLVFGGEGLEADLLQAASERRLFGILNGCEYPATADQPERLSPPALAEVMRTALYQWLGASAQVESTHFIALERASALARMKTTDLLLTGVGRLTAQKAELFRRQVTLAGVTQSALEHILMRLGERGVFMFLGSGDPVFETFMRRVAAQHTNFIFLRGYSDPLARALYDSGQLFLMPSSFEPCGISQMLAMRAGQPCLVHAVGGLKDTVIDGKTGFSFVGDNADEQASAFVHRFEQVLNMMQTNPAQYQKIATEAAQARFTWSAAATEYRAALYNFD